MNPNTVMSLHQVVDNDKSLDPEFKYKFKLVLDGLINGTGAKTEINLLKPNEAAKKLGVGKSSFYNAKDEYPELKQVEFAGCKNYRSDWIEVLIIRLSLPGTPQLLKRNLPSTQQQQKRRAA